MDGDTATFEEHRGSLLGLAYRMLGDFQGAEDIVQDAWLRWSRREAEVASPKAYLVRMVTRLCLTELASARVRREEARGDRLPEPVCLGPYGLPQGEMHDQLSMAFMVLLQRLTGAERAVLLLHDIFDFDHQEISDLVGKSNAACRQLLRRAREHVATQKRALQVPPETHRGMLRAFMRAALAGDRDELTELLREEVVLIADAGPEGATFGRVRNLQAPLVGRAKVAPFLATVTPQGPSSLSVRESLLNGQPALVISQHGRPHTAILLSLIEGQIAAIFMQSDARKLHHLGAEGPPPS